MFTLVLATLILGRPSSSHALARMDTTYRWMLLQTDLRQAPEVDKAIKAIDSAGAAGYNGAILRDASLEASPRITPAYKAALDRVMDEAKKLNIDLIPSIAPVGSPQDILDHDPSLVESLPYRGVRFLVAGGLLKPGTPPIVIPNGGFDAFTGDLPTGFKGGHQGDVTVFADAVMKHGGASSMRVEGQPTAVRGKGGASYQIPVPVLPFHQYRVSIWTKAATADGADVSVNALSTSGSAVGFLDWRNTPDWIKNDMVFDSMGDSVITLSVTIQPVPGAKVWVDDLTIEDAGLLNVTRRGNCPVIIRGDDGAFFNEIVDVNEIVDPIHPAGTGPGHFDVSHAAPIPTLTPLSRLHEGQTVLMDYYAASIINGAATLCVSESKTKAILKAEIQRVVSLMHPRFLFLNISNVQSLGWDPGCEATGLSGGGILGRFVRDEAAAIQGVDPSIQVVTLNDMFDPYQNSLGQFFMVKGGTSGSIDTVPKNVIIANWNSQKPTDSINFFSRHGLTQVLLGYYDDTAHPMPIAEWEKLASGVTGVKGLGYATWLNDYTHLTDLKVPAAGGHN